VARFGKSSLTRLETSHEDLQLLFLQVVSTFDCSIICGHRDEEAQNKAFNDNLSKLKFPNSKHNSYPSMAIDVIPYPVDWHDLKRMHYFAGYVKATAEQLKKDQLISHDIRWGGDWDSDTQVNDQTFIDLPHFELT
jgi:peptidoglycan L-alanyl-D-glutamate endopeptidase CwlK